MDHLLVAGFDIGRKTAPSAALRERARRSAERLIIRRFTRNIPERRPRSLLITSTHS
ncbi:MAG: hypothetical protein H0U66_15105 [Gemmatimonadaceae bacterium]|nr:hypothetical protein [Gemmatimonadaceae bacterium]